MESFIPKAVKRNSHFNPWFNNYLQSLVNTKKRKWAKFRNNRSRRNKRDYNRYCKFVKTELNKAKADYEKSIFLHKNVSQKQFFSYVGQVNNSRNDSDIPH